MQLALPPSLEALRSHISDVQDFLLRLEQVPLDDVSRQKLSIIRQELAQMIPAEGMRLRVVVLGAGNVGKSTLINAWIGEHYLPTSFRAETVVPVRVQHSSQPADAKGRLYERGQAIYITPENPHGIRQWLAGRNGEARARAMGGTSPRKAASPVQTQELALRVFVQGIRSALGTLGFEIPIEIVDTGGVTDDSETARAETAQVLAVADAIVVMVKEDNLGQRYFEDLLDAIRSKNMVSDLDSRVLFILNIYDDTLSSASIEQRKQAVASALKGLNLRVNATDVHAVRARHALIARILRSRPIDQDHGEVPADEQELRDACNGALTEETRQAYIQRLLDRSFITEVERVVLGRLLQHGAALLVKTHGTTLLSLLERIQAVLLKEDEQNQSEERRILQAQATRRADGEAQITVLKQASSEWTCALNVPDAKQPEGATARELWQKVSDALQQSKREAQAEAEALVTAKDLATDEAEADSALKRILVADEGRVRDIRRKHAVLLQKRLVRLQEEAWGKLRSAHPQAALPVKEMALPTSLFPCLENKEKSTLPNKIIAAKRRPARKQRTLPKSWYECGDPDTEIVYMVPADALTKTYRRFAGFPFSGRWQHPLAHFRMFCKQVQNELDRSIQKLTEKLKVCDERDSTEIATLKSRRDKVKRHYWEGSRLVLALEKLLFESATAGRSEPSPVQSAGKDGCQSVSPDHEQQNIIAKRKELNRNILMSMYISDFDAFVIDNFTSIFKRYSSGTDRVEKINQLFLLADHNVLCKAIDDFLLQKAKPDEDHSTVALREAPSRAKQSSPENAERKLALQEEQGKPDSHGPSSMSSTPDHTDNRIEPRDNANETHGAVSGTPSVGSGWLRLPTSQPESAALDFSTAESRNASQSPTLEPTDGLSVKSTEGVMSPARMSNHSGIRPMMLVIGAACVLVTLLIVLYHLIRIRT